MIWISMVKKYHPTVSLQWRQLMFQLNAVLHRKVQFLLYLQRQNGMHEHYRIYIRILHFIMLLSSRATSNLLQNALKQLFSLPDIMIHVMDWMEHYPSTLNQMFHFYIYFPFSYCLNIVIMDNPNNSENLQLIRISGVRLYILNCSFLQLIYKLLNFKLQNSLLNIYICMYFRSFQIYELIHIHWEYITNFSMKILSSQSKITDFIFWSTIHFFSHLTDKNILCESILYLIKCYAKRAKFVENWCKTIQVSG